MRSSYLLSLVAAFALVGAGCATSSQMTIDNSATTTPSTTSPTTTVALPTYPEEENPVRQRPAGTICDPANFICVSENVIGRQITSPINVMGSAIAFENTFQWSLKGSANQNIASGTLTANAPDIGQPGPFVLSQAITIPNGIATGTLRFFENAAKDGVPTHILDIPVTF